MKVLIFIFLLNTFDNYDVDYLQKSSITQESESFKTNISHNTKKKIDYFYDVLSLFVVKNNITNLTLDDFILFINTF